MVLNLYEEKLEKACRVQNVPESVYYVRDYLDEVEEQRLITQVYAAPRPKWTQLKNRRLQYWGGQPPQSVTKPMMLEALPDWLDYYCNKLQEIKIYDTNKPNHVLINEYEPGQGIMPHQDGGFYYPSVCNISLSSPIVMDFYRPLRMVENTEPKDAESTTTPKEATTGDKPPNLAKAYMFSLLLEPRSILILKKDMYECYLHGIRDTDTDVIHRDRIANYDMVDQKTYDCYIDETSNLLKMPRNKRVSLTIRYVSKTVKPNPILLNTLMNKMKS